MTRPAIVRQPTGNGFSLVEMLVALAITGVAATLLAAGIARIGQTVARTQQADNRIDEVQRVQFRLRTLLESATPLGDGQTGGTGIDFRGNDIRLDFVANAPDRASPDAPWRYRLVRNTAGDLMLYTLNRLDAVIDPRAPETQGWQATRLLAGTEAFELRYYGPQPAAADGPAWQRTWGSRPQLPLLVQIDVRFADDDRRTWPDLVIHPRGATTSPCPAVARADRCGAKS
ncbi:prepilin-type N-terminal cleavage/methylation domain-containing protein [Novosphingobium sp.]|uniref:prepilin-type N-terminal cleavage/methylation domain-containing protein n=1 Tax=Novosphingobium sp. TaxID=1874826 RepID=UPI0038B7BB1E